MTKHYYVYIMSTKTRKLYTGMTNNLPRRVYEHKNKSGEGFTSKYNFSLLVYYEVYTEVKQALLREKQIKGLLRVKKIELIAGLNPSWQDLSLDWNS
jgi:putative endonuclease